MMPFWWADGVRVVSRSGAQRGTISKTGQGADWIVSIDGDDRGVTYVVSPDPDQWCIEVKQDIDAGQRDRIVHDAQRAVLRAFGCHYVPAYDELPESMRGAANPKAVNRPELDGIQALVRGAVSAALTPYVR